MQFAFPQRANVCPNHEGFNSTVSGENLRFHPAASRPSAAHASAAIFQQGRPVSAYARQPALSSFSTHTDLGQSVVGHSHVARGTCSCDRPPKKAARVRAWPNSLWCRDLIRIRRRSRWVTANIYAPPTRLVPEGGSSGCLLGTVSSPARPCQDAAKGHVAVGCSTRCCAAHDYETSAWLLQIHGMDAMPPTHAAQTVARLPTKPPTATSSIR